MLTPAIIKTGLTTLSIAATLLLNGCALPVKAPLDEQKPTWGDAKWNESSATHDQLVNLPQPSGRIATSVYSFRDQTGQFKTSPSNAFSTVVTQGASAILIKAIKDSGWFVPLEREGLQNLLTERKIIRATIKKHNKEADLPPLLGANIILESGIISYESNLKTGGSGAVYFGVGASGRYQIDKVTINLRAVDIKSGKIINSITVSKAIYSQEVRAGVFRFVKFKRLLEIEAGYTDNEPVHLALVDAIETAVIRLVVSGIQDKHWQLKNPELINHSTIRHFSIKPDGIRL